MIKFGIMNSQDVFGNYAIHSKDYFLTFADKNKRNSLSASFGITEIKEEWRQRYCSWLESFSKLSVREKEAAQLIQKLIGRTVQILIDPTMYLTESDWRKNIVKAETNRFF